MYLLKQTCPFSDTKKSVERNYSIFIKSVVFHHVGLSWMIQTKEKIEFYADEIVSHCCKYEPWYNTTNFHNLHGSIFKDLSVTACQDSNDLICSLNTYTNMHGNFSEKVISGIGRPLQEDYTTDYLKYISVKSTSYAIV